MLLLSKYLVVILFFLLVSTGLCRVVTGTEVCTEQVCIAESETEQLFSAKTVENLHQKARVLKSSGRIQLDMPTDKYKHYNLPAKYISSEVINVCPEAGCRDMGTYVNDLLAIRHLHGYYIYSLCELLI